MGYAIVTILAVLFGFFGSLVALFKHRGYRGVLVPGVVALILSGIMLLVMGSAFLSARDRALGRRQEAAKNEEAVRQRLAPKPAAKDGVAPPPDAEVQRFETAAKKMAPSIRSLCCTLTGS